MSTAPRFTSLPRGHAPPHMDVVRKAAEHVEEALRPEANMSEVDREIAYLLAMQADDLALADYVTDAAHGDRG